jgi:hypothetical protein
MNLPSAPPLLLLSGSLCWYILPSSCGSQALITVLLLRTTWSHFAGCFHMGIYLSCLYGEESEERQKGGKKTCCVVLHVRVSPGLFLNWSTYALYNTLFRVSPFCCVIRNLRWPIWCTV